MPRISGNHFYEVYLASPEWKDRRAVALSTAGHKCHRCPATKGLEVHHITYDRLGFERPQDLEVLCNSCHAREHGRGAKNDPVVSLRDLEEKGRPRLHLEWEQEDILRPILEAEGIDAEQWFAGHWGV